jgi:dipeptidase E
MGFLLTSFRWHEEPQHPQRAGRPPGQTDCRVQCPLHSHRGVRHARRSRHGLAADLRKRVHPPLCELGWKSLGVLELTALPSIDEEQWVPMVQETDALLVGGGDPLYLCYWMRQSGLADLLPSLETVYVGVSAGSMVMAPNVGEDFVGWKPPTGGDRALGLVEFSMFPHLDHERLPDNSMANAEKWAAGMPVPAYAIDDQTAIKVTDGIVEVVSEGHWKLFTP